MIIYKTSPGIGLDDILRYMTSQLLGYKWCNTLSWSRLTISTLQDMLRLQCWSLKPPWGWIRVEASRQVHISPDSERTSKTILTLDLISINFWLWDVCILQSSMSSLSTPSIHHAKYHPPNGWHLLPNHFNHGKLAEAIHCSYGINTIRWEPLLDICLDGTRRYSC